MTVVATQESLSRRKLLKGLAATSAVLAASPVLAAADHSHHHHHASSMNKSLIKISNECAQHGDECIAHCIELFKTGDTTLAKCALFVKLVLTNAANTLKLMQIVKPVQIHVLSVLKKPKR